MSLDVATLTGTVEHNVPLTFQEAWASVIRNPTTRLWAFNNRPLTAVELLRARENRPVHKTLFIDPPPQNSLIDVDMYRRRIEELFCTCYRLRDGTQLGFTVNSKSIDTSTGVFAPFNPCFRDPRLIVSRLIVGAVGRRVFQIEFVWLVSGALTIRYSCYKTLSDAKRNELRMNMTVIAFLPSDVPILSAVALCPGQPNLDFVEARFERYLISDEWYMITTSDTSLQSACVFCASRGSAVCSCPLPMRRRAASKTNVIGYKARPGKTCWDEFGTILSICAAQRSMLYNLVKSAGTPYRKVLASGIVPIEWKIDIDIITHGCLQMHLGLTGAHPETAITRLTPFSSSEDGRKRLLSAGASSESNSFTSFQPVSTQSGSSHEHITLNNTETNKRPKKIETTSTVNVDDWVNWNDETEPEIEVNNDADEVVDATVVDASIVEVFSTKKEVNNKKISNGGQINEGEKLEAVKIFECPECGLQIRNKRSNLKRHIQVVHMKERRFQCVVSECGQRFQTKTNLKRHVNSVHKRLIDSTNKSSVTDGNLSTR